MKKVISSFLAIIMIATTLFAVPFTVKAEETKEIWNINDLYNVRDDMNANYILMTDIDLTSDLVEGGDYCFNYDKGWNPIGSDNKYADVAFTGIFDGNNHSIIGLRINNTVNKGYFGLFSKNEGTIKNLNLENVDILASHGYIGGIVAYNSNSVYNCHILSGNIVSLGGTAGEADSYKSYGNLSEYRNFTYTGGISSYNNGIIENCSNRCNFTISSYYSSSSTSGITYVTEADCGGICGYNNTEILKCFNCGNIVVGEIKEPFYNDLSSISGDTNYESGSILNCYNTGYVETIYNDQYAISNHGRIVNCYSVGNSGTYFFEPYHSSVEDCYYLQGTTQACTGATPLSDSQMQIEERFVGFDFENIWTFDETTEYKYPQLRDNRQDKGHEIDTVELISAPTKTEYRTEDELDLTGAQIGIYYKDGEYESKDITENMISNVDMLTVGKQTVTVNHRGYKVSFDINVSQRPEVLYVDLLSIPNKTTFIRGTELDYTGAVARIYYVDDTYEDVELTPENTTGGTTETTGNYTVIYGYKGQTTSFNITVTPLKIVSIKITSFPTTLNYKEGTEIDTTGMVVTATYNTGEEKEITSYNLAYDKSFGTQVVTVSNSGQQDTFEVEFAHNYQSIPALAATCTTDGHTAGVVCSYCGDVKVATKEVKAYGHNYEIKSTSGTATCVTPVKVTFECTRCSDTYTENEILNAENHEGEEVSANNAIAPTCTKDGKLSDTMCSMCGTILTEGNVIKAIGHSYTSSVAKAPTCTESGTKTYTCLNCHDSYTETIPATGHKTTTTVTKATTSKDGKIVKYCSVCKKTLSTTVIPRIYSVKLSGTSYAYNGKVKTPSVTVKNRTGKTLVKNTDYTVSYAKGRKYVGKYAVKVTFKGKYSGTKTLYFKIKPKSTSISSLKAGSKKFTVKWYKRTTQTTGYQVQYSTSSKFTSPKTVTISKTGITSKTVSKLKAKKKYYVRVRTYKAVNGTRYYSSWSKAKYVTTKS